MSKYPKSTVGGRVRADVNEELKFVKIKNKFGGGGEGGEGQGGCERRIEVFVKIQKKIRGGGRVGLGVGVQGGCGQRIEVFVRVDMNEEFKFL